MTHAIEVVLKPRILKNAPVLIGLIIGTFVFALFFNFHLDKLHINGYLTDEGWINGMIWRKPRLDPLAFQWAGSFYNVHVSPILSLASWLSFLWPLDKTSWLASFFSFPPAISVALFTYIAISRAIPLVLQRRFWMASSQILVIPIAISGAFAANPGYAHFEIWAVSLIVLATYFFLTDRQILSCWFLLLCLAVREDVGTYVAVACLSLSIFGNVGQNRKRVLRYCATICGLYSIGATLVRARVGGSHSLETSLFGDPFLGHVNTAFIRERLQGLSTAPSATLILMPLALIVILAVIQRNRIALCLATLALPQLAISMIAVFPTAGLLGLHYGFPVTMAVCASYLSLILVGNDSFEESNTRAVDIGVRFAGAYIGAVAIFGALTSSVFTSSIGDFPSLSERREREVFIQRAVDSGLKIDPAVAALEPDVVPIESLADKAELAKFCSLISLTATFDGSQVVPSVGLAASGKQDGLPEGFGIVNPGGGCQIPTSRPYQSRTFVYLPIRLPSDTGKIRKLERYATANTDQPGLVTYGPYATLPSGRYKFTVAYRSSLDDRRSSGRFDVTGGLSPGAKVFGAIELRGTNSSLKRSSIALNLSSEDAQNLELRIFWKGRGSIAISRVEIRPIND